MIDISVRQCVKEDESAIVDICYRTGFMGEDLTGMDRFNDKILFGYLFCSYYIRYEPDKCFVVENGHGQIVGYVIGTDDTKRQMKLFAWKMLSKIFTRLLFHTLWAHRESIHELLSFIKTTSLKHQPKGLYKNYPAHLHINVLPGQQNSGLGSKLLNTFEEKMKHIGVTGIHLRTSNKNSKALPFYLKNGYKIVTEVSDIVWSGVSNYKSIIFVKSL